MIGIGRLLLGIGLSTALMAAFKGVRTWRKIDDIPRWNGLVLGIGALGGVLSTWPAGILSELLGWRFVYVAVALLISASWVGVLLFVPQTSSRIEPAHIDILKAIRTPVLWQIGLASALSVGMASAAQSLWAGLWLAEIVGQSTVRTNLLVMSLATIVGSFGLGAAASFAARRGISTDFSTLIGIVAFGCVQAGLIFVAPSSLGLWAAFAAFGTAGMLTFSSIAEKVSVEETATVNSIYNMMTFGAAILVQVSIGVISDTIKLFSESTIDSYRYAFLCILILQATACIWFLFDRLLLRKIGI